MRTVDLGVAGCAVAVGGQAQVMKAGGYRAQGSRAVVGGWSVGVAFEA